MIAAVAKTATKDAAGAMLIIAVSVVFPAVSVV